jgi:hypothetical protein
LSSNSAPVELLEIQIVSPNTLDCPREDQFRRLDAISANKKSPMRMVNHAPGF